MTRDTGIRDEKGNMRSEYHVIETKSITQTAEDTRQDIE